MDTLVSSVARTSSGNSGILNLANPQFIKAALFELDVSLAANVAGDKLNVFIQHSVDGTNFDDFVHFTEVLGDGGANRYLATWVRDVSPESEMKPLTDGSLSAGSVLQGPVGDIWRVKWVITDGGAHGQSFTFLVGAVLIYDERARAAL